MKGLFIYDVINLKSYSKIFLILAAFFMIYASVTKSPSYFSGMLFMLFAMLPVSSLAMDEKSGWDKYIATLPVKKTYYVAEKYLLFIILDLAAVFVTFILSFILSIGIQETIITLVSMFCVCMLFESLILPFVRCV